MTTNKEILTIFGNNLRTYRRQKRLSQRGLFALCGIDNGTICRMENGKHNITLNTVAMLAEALEVPAWKLLMVEEEKIAEDTKGEV